MNSISRNTLLGLVLGAGLAMPQGLVAQTPSSSETFVLLRDGRLRVLDDRILLRTDTVAGQVQFHLAPQGETTATQVLRFQLADVVSITSALPSTVQLPRLTSYKVTTKANANVSKDAVGKLSEDGNAVDIRIASIDRTVRPTFELESADAARGVVVYVEGKRQQSGVSLVHLDSKTNYLLTDPNYERMTLVETSPATPSTPPTTTEKASRIALTAAMLSSNYPSQNPGEELANLVDENPSTYFHSLWDKGLLDESVIPYINIALPEPLKTFQFEYLTRTSSYNNMPSELTLLTSTDGVTWSELRTFTAADGLPQMGNGQRFRSENLTAAAPFSYLRLRCDKSTRRNYLVLAELSLYKMEQVSVPGTSGSPAVYAIKAQPYGRSVSVTADFPASKATQVPRIDITLKDGVTVLDIHNNKSKYRRADIKIDGAGVWENLTDSVSIKGRGNSTWGMYKKPYRLKFAKGIKPFGLHKGKSWVLLANALSDYSTGGGAHLNNAIAMKAAQLVGTAAVNHIIPVDLYINNEYMGAYSFTEQVGISGNSVNLNDSIGALLELDTYDQDGDPFFYDTAYNLRTKYKDPEPKDYLKDFGQEAHDNFYATLHSEFRAFTEAVKTGDYDSLIDIPSLVRYFMANDLIGNLEFGHPKSTYLHRSDIFDASTRWIFGPVWDCDWAYGYEHSGEFGIASPEFDVFKVAPAGNGRTLFIQLLQGSDEVRKQYYLLWKDFVNNGGLDALTHYIDEYQQFVQPSLTLDYERYHRGPGNYAGMAARLKSWLTRRAHYILDNLDAFPDTPTGLETVLAPTQPESNTAAPQPVRKGTFTLTGQRISTPRHALKSGLYLIDGHKVMVK